MGHAGSFLIFALLVVFVLYRRVRRTVGFQPLRARRMTVRTVLLVIAAILLLLPDAAHPMAFVGAGIGVVVGLILSYYAIRTTVFEQRGDGWYYRPNAWIGVILLALFIARIAVRIFTMYTVSATHLPGNASSGQVFAAYGSDPWTVAALLALVAYFVTYGIYLLRKEKSLGVPDTQSWV